jgi:hypothetical protein
MRKFLYFFERKLKMFRTLVKEDTLPLTLDQLKAEKEILEILR